jgi:pimeloyl-ACP methyl ester carboxylesterase
MTLIAMRVRFLGQGPVNCVLLGVFLSVGTMALFGLIAPHASDPDVRFGSLQHGKDPNRLFVLVHGLSGGSRSWVDVEPVLDEAGDTIALNYGAGAFSNSEPEELAKRMSEKIQEVQAPYREIVLVAHSMGALLARQAFLFSAQDPNGWATKTKRIVLLAGMNRGWSLGGERPMDMAIETRLEFWIGAWFGRLTNLGRLILGTQSGSKFVSNLRMDWMEHFRSATQAPTVVQLLGDVDDIVSEEDDKDVRVAAGTIFFGCACAARTTQRSSICTIDRTPSRDTQVSVLTASKSY